MWQELRKRKDLYKTRELKEIDQTAIRESHVVMLLSPHLWQYYPTKNMTGISVMLRWVEQMLKMITYLCPHCLYIYINCWKWEIQVHDVLMLITASVTVINTLGLSGETGLVTLFSHSPCGGSTCHVHCIVAYASSRVSLAFASGCTSWRHIRT